MPALRRPAPRTVAAIVVVVAVLTAAGLVTRSVWYELGTSVVARAEQDQLRSAWEQAMPSTPPSAVAAFPTDTDSGSTAGETDDAPLVGGVPSLSGDGKPVAAVRFHRPGHGPLVSDLPLVAVSGVSAKELRGGVGHYPSSALPGQQGNFALAGHRTTHAKPFTYLDVLERGDEILVQDLDGRVWVYVVKATIITTPDDTTVLSGDPLAVGKPTITLTTCHPRGSARERLVVFGVLRDDQLT